MNNIKTALDTLKANIPRTLVQVVTMFDVTPLQNFSTGPVCDAMHRYVHVYCTYKDHNNYKLRIYHIYK